MKYLVALLLATATSVHAADWTIEGSGRISVVGGYRWTPNWYFFGKAKEQGITVDANPGGAQGAASFGYGVTDYAELAVDAAIGWETFTLSGSKPYTSLTYGALIGPRLTKIDWPFNGFVPHLSVQFGPTLATVTSPTNPGEEKSMLGTSVSGGFTLRLQDRWGITFDVRWLQARAYVPSIAAANVGGVWFSIGVTMYVPGTTPKKDLDVPGFSNP